MDLRKTNASGYVLDPQTNTIINNNMNELKSYRKSVEQHRELQNVKGELTSLRSEMAEIKRLLAGK